MVCPTNTVIVLIHPTLPLLCCHSLCAPLPSLQLPMPLFSHLPPKKFQASLSFTGLVFLCHIGLCASFHPSAFPGMRTGLHHSIIIVVFLTTNIFTTDVLHHHHHQCPLGPSCHHHQQHHCHCTDFSETPYSNH